jgi:hypothetical protein
LLRFVFLFLSPINYVCCLYFFLVSSHCPFLFFFFTSISFSSL